MFQNVPEKLVRTLTRLPSQFRDKDVRYFAAATAIIVQYLQKIFSDSEKTASAFLEQPHLQLEQQSQLRILSVGMILFELRNCSGFVEMCRRLRGRDLRATFFELYAAHMFFCDGFDIFAQPETGTKGVDFDFQARRRGVAINAEVTALTAAQFSAPTVENALEQKRKQLPKSSPAIIFCAIPSNWYGAESDLNEKLRTIATDFLRQTGRINTVVYVTDPYITDMADTEASGLMFCLLAVDNVNARCSTPTLPFLYFRGRNDRIFRRMTESGTAGLSDIGKQLAPSEFFRWADSVLDG
jgi:hypothetical protein